MLIADRYVITVYYAACIFLPLLNYWIPWSQLWHCKVHIWVKMSAHWISTQEIKILPLSLQVGMLIWRWKIGQNEHSGQFITTCPCVLAQFPPSSCWPWAIIMGKADERIAYYFSYTLLVHAFEANRQHTIEALFLLVDFFPHFFLKGWNSKTAAVTTNRTVRNDNLCTGSTVSYYALYSQKTQTKKTPTFFED